MSQFTPKSFSETTPRLSLAQYSLTLQNHGLKHHSFPLNCAFNTCPIQPQPLCELIPERQKALTPSTLHTQLDPFAAKLTDTDHQRPLSVCPPISLSHYQSVPLSASNSHGINSITKTQQSCTITQVRYNTR